MKCLVCGKTINENSVTCPKRCAGLMSASVTKQRAYIKRYQNPDKLKNMYKILLIVKDVFYSLPDGIKPNFINCIDLFGGGVFLDLFKDTFKPGNYYSIDFDDSLELAMKKTEYLYNKDHSRKWFFPITKQSIYNFLGRLKGDQLLNIENTDVTYFDYCGFWIEDKKQDIEYLGYLHSRKIYQKPKLLFITINRSREYYKGESLVFAKDFKTCFVSQINNLLPGPFKENPIYFNEYKNGSNIMQTYGFKYCINNDSLHDYTEEKYFKENGNGYKFNDKSGCYELIPGSRTAYFKGKSVVYKFYKAPVPL
jgi:hypothetical protein